MLPLARESVHEAHHLVRASERADMRQLKCVLKQFWEAALERRVASSVLQLGFVDEHGAKQHISALFFFFLE